MTKLKSPGIADTNFRRVLLAAQQVIGDEELYTLLHKVGLSRFVNNIPEDSLDIAVSSEEFSQLNLAIEETYGRGGKAVLRRIGQEMFQSTVREQPALLGVAGVALKVMPKRQRIRFILNSMASAVRNTNPGVEAKVEENDDKIAYLERNCAICHGRESDRPICYLHIGELTAAVHWAVGNQFEIREAECIARGDNVCRFELIEKE